MDFSFNVSEALEYMSQSIPTGYIPRALAQKACPGGWDLIFESCPGAGNSTRARIMWKTKLKLQKIAWIKFLQVKAKKKTTLLISSTIYAQEASVFPVF